MFKTRLISGIILVIIALATIISGSWILFFTLSGCFTDRNERALQGNEGK